MRTHPTSSKIHCPRGGSSAIANFTFLSFAHTVCSISFFREQRSHSPTNTHIFARNPPGHRASASNIHLYILLPSRYDVIVRDGFFSFQGKDRLPSSRRRDAGNNPFAKNSRKIPGKNKHSPIDRSTRSTHKKSKGNKRWKEVRKLDLLLQPGVSTWRTGGDDRSTGRPHGTHTSLPLYLFRLRWLAGRTQSRCRRRTTTNDPTTTTYYRELNGTGAGSAADRQSPVGVSCISSCALADDQPAGPDETQIGGLLSASSHADRWESGKLSPKLWRMRKL